MEKADTIIIGAGQAGLATSFFLTEEGRDHIVLERGRVAETWRTRRWDSFTLVAPNWSCQLPGKPYEGQDPDGFMDREALVRFFESYARSFGAPVREGTEVKQLTWNADRSHFVLEADGERYAARHVVVATGAFQRPRVPPEGAKLDPRIVQLVADDYRNADQLPDGGVLVVGSGQSGCQIAEELIEAGRAVYLSTGSCGWLPRRYRGRDNVRWRDAMGLWDDTVDVLPSPMARFTCAPIQTGKEGGHDINLRTLARSGVTLAGRFADAEGARVRFAPDLHENLATSDDVAREFIAKVELFIREDGIEAPPEDEGLFFEPRIARVDELDLVRAGVSTVLWGIGYVLNFNWIQQNVFDEYGYPVQQQGVTDLPGLYFMGLHWMYKRKSGLIFGVGEDGQHVVDHIEQTARIRG